LDKGDIGEVFDVLISDPSSMTIFYGKYLHSILFTFKNGFSRFYGDNFDGSSSISIEYKYTKRAFINLDDYNLTRIRVTSGWRIDGVSLNYKISDRIDNFWTDFYSSQYTSDLKTYDDIYVQSALGFNSDQMASFNIHSIYGRIPFEQLSVQNLRIKFSFCYSPSG
jgi:hypothetical protein